MLNEKYESVLKESRLVEPILKRYAQQALNNSFYVAAMEPGSAWKVLQALQGGDADGEKVRYVQKPVRRSFECAAAALLFFCIGFVIGGLYAKED